MKGKVLFIFPNNEGYAGVPNGLALLSGCLKESGYETKCFDTTFYVDKPKTLIMREKHGGVKKLDFEEFWHRDEITDMNGLREKLKK